MTNPHIVEVLPLIAQNNADGPSYSVMRLCEALIERNNNITLANCEVNKIISPPIFIKRFPLGIGPKKLCRSPLMYRWLLELSRTGKISLIHTHGLWTMPVIYPGLMSKKFSVPLISSPRGSLSPYAMQSGSWVKKVFWPLFQHPALKLVKCFHATSESEYLDIRNMGFKQPVAVIPNGIDIPLKKFIQPVSKLRTLLFLGRINQIKGLDMLLPAWQVLQHQFPDWQLCIAGPDSRGYLDSIKQMAHDMGLTRITFPGLLVEDDKWSAFQNAQLFILPSYTENFGVSVAEALASGTPVITTTGTPWELLKLHNAGWWIEIGTDKLIHCLQDALNRPQTELSQMGQNGRAWMEQEFSWSGVGGMMSQTYSWMLNGGEVPKWVHLD